jgi:hypothetical protein
MRSEVIAFSTGENVNSVIPGNSIYILPENKHRTTM